MSEACSGGTRPGLQVSTNMSRDMQSYDTPVTNPNVLNSTKQLNHQKQTQKTPINTRDNSNNTIKLKIWKIVIIDKRNSLESSLGRSHVKGMEIL